MPAQPNIWRHVYFFESIQPAVGAGHGSAKGWTEVVYVANNNTDIEVELNYALNTDWVSRRSLFMSEFCSISWVRVNRIGQRNVKVGNVGIGGGGFSADPGAQTTCAVLVDFTAPPIGVAPDNASHRRNYLLRGLPTTIMRGDVLLTASPAFGLLQNFCRFMANQINDVVPIPGAAGPGLPNIIIPYDNPNNDWQAITAVPVIANRSFSITAALGPITSADHVRIRRVGVPRQLNGLFSSQGASPGPNYILGRTRRPIVGAWSGDGQARLVQTWGAPIKNFLIIGLRTKKTGRPFRQPAGRARAR
jgi:hypothetical protein